MFPSLFPPPPSPSNPTTPSLPIVLLGREGPRAGQEGGREERGRRGLVTDDNNSLIFFLIPPYRSSIIRIIFRGVKIWPISREISGGTFFGHFPQKRVKIEKNIYVEPKKIDIHTHTHIQTHALLINLCIWKAWDIYWGCVCVCVCGRGGEGGRGVMAFTAAVEHCNRNHIVIIRVISGCDLLSIVDDCKWGL